MQHQSAAPGPEIGWGFGLIGFLASALIGWFLDVGVGFLLLLLIFWSGVGTLFAFLVERSTVEEHDRVDELRSTRLDKLDILPPSAPEPRAHVEPAPAPGPTIKSSPIANEDEATRAERRRREAADHDHEVCARRAVPAASLDTEDPPTTRSEAT